jgi:hypothetical protein
VVSAADPEARHIRKNRTRHQDSFEGHVSFEPETGLFTAVALTGGSGAGSHEAAVAPGLLADEQEKLTILGDAAYGTGELREHLQADGHAMVIKPPPLRQAIPGGFTIGDFTIDDQAGTVTCPAGHTVTLGRPHADGARLAQFKAACRTCPLRERCTTSKTGRTLQVPPSMPCWPPRSAPPPIRPGRPNTADGVPPSSGPSPGWPPAKTAASPTAASPRTTPGSATGPPPSTSAA